MTPTRHPLTDAHTAALHGPASAPAGASAQSTPQPFYSPITCALNPAPAHVSRPVSLHMGGNPSPVLNPPQINQASDGAILPVSPRHDLFTRLKDVEAHTARLQARYDATRSHDDRVALKNAKTALIAAENDVRRASA